MDGTSRGYARCLLVPDAQPCIREGLQKKRAAPQFERWASRRIRSRSLNAWMFAGSESSSECERRIRLRHVATRSDLVAIVVRVT